MSLLQQVCRESKLLHVSDDGLKVRRATPWPDQDTSRPRSVFCKGVSPSSTLDQLLEYFGQYGVVNAVRFRRTQDRERKNSVFVEFADEPTAAKLVALKEGEFMGEKITFESNESYSRRKRDKQRGPQNRKKDKRPNPASGTDMEEKKLFASGTVVHFSGIGTGLSRQALKEVFEEYGTPGSVKSIDYANGSSEGYVRLDNEIMASFMVEKMQNSKAVVDKEVPTLRILEGQEFEEYLQKMTLLDGIKTAAPQKKRQKQGKPKDGNKRKHQGKKGKEEEEKKKE